MPEKRIDDFGYFNPLPPCGGRLVALGYRVGADKHFNPLPPCGGRQ